jgi:Flp pilus assembly protein TadG
LRADRAGSTAVEFALVAPFLLTLFFGVFEFARAIWTQSALDFAVQQAARCATIDNTTTCNSATNTQKYAAAQTGPLAIAQGSFTLTTPGCGNQVAASYAFHFLLPSLLTFGLLHSSITLSSTACYPV